MRKLRHREAEVAEEANSPGDSDPGAGTAGKAAGSSLTWERGEEASSVLSFYYLTLPLPGTAVEHHSPQGWGIMCNKATQLVIWGQNFIHNITIKEGGESQLGQRW